MSKSRNLHIFALLCNLAIVVFAVIGLFLLATLPNMTMSLFAQSLKYFTVITAFVSGIVSIIAAIFHIKSIKNNKDCCTQLIYVLRFSAATMGLITFITVFAILIPMTREYELLLAGNGLFLHILLPAFSVGCFILFEIEPKFRFRNCFIPLLITLIYGASIIICVVVINAIYGIDAAKNFAPYPFFQIIPGMPDYTRNIVICAIILVGALVVAVALWCLNRIVSSIVIGYEVPIANKDAKSTTKKVSSKKKSLSSSTTAFNKYDNNRVYHISIYDHKLKNWKVKLATGERAIKVFRTQQEAIDYATELARRCGGSVRVHSRLGRIRKD